MSRASYDLSTVGGWVPTRLGGCFLWLRADTGITQVAGAVSVWADQSGYGNDVSQAMGARQPTLNVTDVGYNNQATLSFVQANDSCLFTDTLPPTPQPVTVYFVGESTSGVLQQQPYGSSNPNTTGPYWNYTAWAVYAGVIFTPPGPVDVSRTKNIWACVFNGAASSLYWNDPSNVMAGDAGTDPFYSSGDFAVGDLSDGGSGGLNGKIAEFLCFYGAHTLTQVQEAFAYLIGRYSP